jgi:hypothetical protein
MKCPLKSQRLFFLHDILNVCGNNFHILIHLCLCTGFYTQMSQRAVEDVYKKQTQHEHILSRPDTYIGSVEPETETMWVVDTECSVPRFVQRPTTISPGLYRVIDELINNAQVRFMVISEDIL